MQTNNEAKVVLANPRGFCAGVDRAIVIVEEALKEFGAPIYVRNEVVHNKFVVNELREKGAVFVKQIEEIPRGSIVIYSAHGVSKQVRAEAEERGLTPYDATCPLVTKVHKEVSKMHFQDMEIIMIGHKGHPEVEGTMGQTDGGMHLVETPEDVATLAVRDPDKLAFVTQTTLSMDDTANVIDALQARFPNIQAPKSDDICYATQNRQDAVKAMAEQCDVVLIVGSPNSSNSNRLREVAENKGIESYMLDDAQFLKPEWVQGKTRVGISAGASAPEILVKDVIQRLHELGVANVEELAGVQENVVFRLPKDLTEAIKLLKKDKANI